MKLKKYPIIILALSLLLGIAACKDRYVDRTKIPGFSKGIKFAHRGVVSQFPENSLGSAEDALALGFSALELDLRKSSEDKWMLFHDENGKRLLGIDTAFVDIPVEKLKIQPLRFNGNNSNNYVLPLSELLTKHNKNFTFYFDVKVDGFTEADELADTIVKYGISDRVIVASADVMFVLYMEWKHPQLFTALEGMNTGKEWMWKIIPNRIKPDFLSGFFERIDLPHVKWLKENELLNRRIVYGVDSTNYIKARKWGIKHLILDYYPGMADQI